MSIPYQLTPAEKLVEDLRWLLHEAEAGEFGDFTSTQYSTPKMALVLRLEIIIENVKNGKYD